MALLSGLYVGMVSIESAECRPFRRWIRSHFTSEKRHQFEASAPAKITEPTPAVSEKPQTDHLIELAVGDDEVNYGGNVAAIVDNVEARGEDKVDNRATSGDIGQCEKKTASKESVATEDESENYQCGDRMQEEVMNKKPASVKAKGRRQGREKESKPMCSQL
jgi:hypothetical protein